jgi:tetratricopeptide (TPR) repeat protein
MTPSAIAKRILKVKRRAVAALTILLVATPFFGAHAETDIRAWARAMRLGEALSEAQRHEDAAIAFRLALQHEPVRLDRARTLYELGRNALSLGDLRGAITYLQQAEEAIATVSGQPELRLAILSSLIDAAVISGKRRVANIAAERLKQADTLGVSGAGDAPANLSGFQRLAAHPLNWIAYQKPVERGAIKIGLFTAPKEARTANSVLDAAANALKAQGRRPRFTQVAADEGLNSVDHRQAWLAFTDRRKGGEKVAGLLGAIDRNTHILKVRCEYPERISIVAVPQVMAFLKVYLEAMPDADVFGVATD